MWGIRWWEDRQFTILLKSRTVLLFYFYSIRLVKGATLHSAVWIILTFLNVTEIITTSLLLRGSNYSYNSVHYVRLRDTKKFFTVSKIFGCDSNIRALSSAKINVRLNSGNVCCHSEHSSPSFFLSSKYLTLRLTKLKVFGSASRRVSSLGKNI